MAWRGLLGVLLLTACSCSEPRAKPAAPRSSTSRTMTPSSEEVVLADSGHANVAIVVPARLLGLEPGLLAPGVAPEPPAAGGPGAKRVKKPRPPKLTREQQQTLAQSRQLWAAVKDLSKYLSRMAGSDVPLVPAPGPDGALKIFIGELAEERFGPVGAHSLGRQGFRYVVGRSGVGLYGESDLANGYAIYELLDRLGCRWFMPGELGEEIPHSSRLALMVSDEQLVPATLYRGLWYADDDFKRRNRLGGLKIAAGHMLERWVSPAQREEHPDWRAEIKGQPDAKRLRWSKPEVATAIATAIDARLEKRPAESVSISPLDGSTFDESIDRSIDAGDWDPTTNHVSLTDRLLVLANRVATQVTAKHPGVMFGLLAYTSYTRAPVREQVHPSVVPVIAPISYCRPHPLTDDACPGAKDLRQIVEGWAARSEHLAFRGYAYNLAEPAAPNPMLRKWSSDLPFLFRNKVQFFQPETLPNFETSLPALWLGIRLSWDHRLAPAAVLDELFQRFYGHASGATRQYVDIIDRAWVETPVYSGAGLGYARRFPPELMTRARVALEQAKLACRTDIERQRVALLDQSFAQLELYMQMELDFRSGRIGALGQNLARWLRNAQELGDRYAPNSAFGKTGWAKASVYGAYVERFLQPIYLEAERIEHEQVVLTKAPVCTARYRRLPDVHLPVDEARGSDAADPSSDFCVDTWSSLGLHDYFGTMRYELELPAQPSSAKASYLWLSKVDGVAQAWVNGKLVRSKAADPTAPPTAEAHLKPLTFDITSALRTDAPNQVVVLVQRTRLAELGAGGLLGPAYVYRDR